MMTISWSFDDGLVGSVEVSGLELIDYIGGIPSKEIEKRLKAAVEDIIVRECGADEECQCSKDNVCIWCCAEKPIFAGLCEDCADEVITDYLDEIADRVGFDIDNIKQELYDEAREEAQWEAEVRADYYRQIGPPRI